MLSVIMLSLNSYYSESNYAECHQAECRFADCGGAAIGLSILSKLFFSKQEEEKLWLIEILCLGLNTKKTFSILTKKVFFSFEIGSQ